jgi:hypothetical protein
MNNQSYIERLREQLTTRGLAIVIVESFFMILINSTTFFGNLLVLLAVYRNPRLRQNILNMYIIGLALSDLLMSLLGILYSTASTVTGRWIFGHFICQGQGFFVLLFCAVSLQTLALTAINRYFRTTRSNAVYCKYFTMKSTKITIAVLWLTAFLAPLPYVAMGHEFIFHPGKVFCTHNFATLVIGYGAFLVVAFVGIPFIIIVFCYTKVFICVRRHNSNFKVHATSNEGTPNLRLSVEEINITWTLMAVVLGFFLCWTPVVVIDLIDFTNSDWKLPRQAYLSYTCFGYSSTAINPFIYGIMNRHFRQEYSKILPFIKAFTNRSLNTIQSAKNEKDKNRSKRNTQSAVGESKPGSNVAVEIENKDEKPALTVN